MANPYGYESAVDDPTAARERADVLAKPLPPPPDHPMIDFANRLAAPMLGPVGPTGPQSPPYPDYGYRTRDPGQQQDYVDRTLRRGAYAPPPNLGPAGSLGPRGPMGPEQPTDLGSRLAPASGMPTRPVDASGLWDFLNSPQSDPFAGLRAGLDKVTQNVAAANRARTDAKNSGDALGAVNATLGTVGALSPQPPNIAPALEAAGVDPKRAAQFGAAGQIVGGLVGGGEGAAKGPLAAAIEARTPRALAEAWQALPEEARTNPAVIKQIQEARSNAMGAFRSGVETDEKTAAAMAAGGLEGAQPRYVVETGKTRSVIRDTQSGETLPFSFTKPETAAAKVAQLNAPTAAANPFQSPEAQMTGALRTLTRAKANPEDSIADVVRRAARAGGPDFTPEFAAAQPALRANIDAALQTAKLEPTDVNAAALAQRLIEQERARPSVGNRNAQKVVDAVTGEDALGAVTKSAQQAYEERVAASKAAGTFNPENPIAAFDEGSFQPDRTGGSAGTGGPKLPGASGPTTSGGGRPPELPPPPPSPNLAKAIALGTLDALTDLPRAIMLTGHLPYLRQALPMMMSAVIRGEPQELAYALWRPVRAALNTDAGRVAMDNSLRRSLIEEGMPETNVSRLLSSQHGPLSAREDFTMTSWLGRLPILKNVNAAYPTVMNSLRTGMALERARMAKAAGQPVNWGRITEEVRHLSGRGDLPGEGNPAVARLWNKAFFGPRLMTSAFQTAADTLKAMRNISSDALSRRPLDVNDIAQVRDVAAYVLGGMTIMQFMQHAGYQIDTDASSRDWGRIIDPDTGHRIDIWGAFGPDARLIAQTLTWVNETQLGIGTPLRPQKYGSDNALDMIVNYLRNKAGPGLPSLALDTVTGNTAGGKPFVLRDQLSAAARDPLSVAPNPLAIEASRAGASPFETALVSAGAGVIETPPKINYDGLGAAQGDPNYQKGSILDAYARIVEASKQSGSPWHGGDPVMAQPKTTIGTGDAEIKLDPKTADRYVKALGAERDRVLGPLVNSSEFQQAGINRQRELFDAAVQKADKTASENFLARDVVNGTDPKMIAAESLQGFLEQTTLKDKAYWIGLLDRVGKLPDAAKAINDYELAHAKEDSRPPITVEEYRRAAPVVHAYLSHVPYGTDSRPIGTPADWATVEKARKSRADREEQLIRSGVNPVIAKRTSEVETARALTDVQRGLFLNGAAAENPERRKLQQTYGSMLTRFLGVDPQFTRETDAQYIDFPNSR